MATIKTDLICNLNQPVNVTYLHGNLFSQDNAGNTINVFVMDNGEPATIGGTVSANVIRSDGQTVAVSGAIEGNKAYVILPQACYAVPGVVHIIIKLTQNTTITTIAAIVANVYMSTTDSVIDPGQVIPSIQALMALIEEAVDSIPTDYTGLLHTIAADYSSSKTYKVGDYAWESGVLKRCIVPITAAETYTAAHWTNAVIGDDLTNLKSAIGELPATIKMGYMLDSSGAETPNQLNDLYIISTTLWDKISFEIANASNSSAYCGFYDEKDNLIGELFRNNKEGTYNYKDTVPVPTGAYKLKLSHRNNVNITPSLEASSILKYVDALERTNKVNAKIYGAIGDGVADDTKALQAAIDYCEQEQNVLYIPAGTYKLTSALVVTTSNVTIVGGGANTVLKQTVAEENVIEISGTAENRISSVSISNITLEGDYNWNGTIGAGSASTGNGCFIEHADTCVFSNVRFRRNGKNGLECGARVWACIFNDCLFAQNKQNGFDSGGIVEETKYRTASTLNFKSCYFYHNQIGVHWQGNQLLMYGGWIEVNNHGIETYQNAPSAGLAMFGTDLEGNVYTTCRINSPINGLKIIGGALTHTGSWSAIVFTSAGNYQNIVLDCLISIGSQLLLEAYSGAYVYVKGVSGKYINSNQNSFRFGNGADVIQRGVRFDDILCNILDYSDGVIIIPPRSGVTIKIKGASRITKLSFSHTDNLPIVYRLGINGTLQRSVTELVDEKREIAVQATDFIMILNDTNSNLRVTDAAVTYLT